MYVNRAGQSRNVVSRRVDKGRSGDGSGGFRLDATGGEGSVQSAGSSAPASNVGALLSIQEVPDASQGRSRGLNRGKDLLAELDAIRVGLLSGRLPRERIERILRLLRQRQDSFGDPHLTEIVAEIEVRAAVELAKLEMSETSSG